MSVLRAPRIALSWTPTALGAAFGGYNVYRQPARGLAFPWSKIGALAVPTGYTQATVEAQHTFFDDWTAGWGVPGGQWADGWNYAVTVVNLATMTESPLAIDSLNVVAPDFDAWVTSNELPHLNFPIAPSAISSADDQTLRSYRLAGRKVAVTRAPLDLPARSLHIEGMLFGRTGEDQVRYWRAAAASGKAFALLLPRGDRIIGGLSAPSKLVHAQAGDLTYAGDIVESDRGDGIVADCNIPAGLVLNGTTQAITVPSNALIDNFAAFSVVVVSAFSGSGGSRFAASKVNTGVTPGWWMSSNAVANQFGFSLTDGTAPDVALFETNAVWFDGNVHVAIGTTDGAAQALYRDDAITPVAVSNVVHTAFTNALALAIGANVGGTANFMAMTPFRAFAFYPRKLTPAEAQATARYFLGYPGYRPAANANLLFDLRDKRTWSGFGTLNDLSAVPPSLTGTPVAGPSTRGIPVDLSVLDQF